MQGMAHGLPLKSRKDGSVEPTQANHSHLSGPGGSHHRVARLSHEESLWLD